MKAYKLLTLSLSMAGVVLLLGCSEENEDSNSIQASRAESDCIGCHTNQEMLIATMSPDTTPEPENPGEG